MGNQDSYPFLSFLVTELAFRSGFFEQDHPVDSGQIIAILLAESS
jgi:hypothetical protein